jgi:aldehyde dehydrogenase (NAD+)
MEEIIKAQRAFFKTNQTKDIAFRIENLKKFAQLLKDNQSQLEEAIYLDFKKSAFDTYTNELALVYNDIEEAIHQVKRWASPQRKSTNWVNFPAKSVVIPEPLGVSLIIGAWNYPYQLSLAPVVAAMAAGNTIILKPSELPAHTSRIMARLINNTFDPQYFKVVEGGIQETSDLLAQRFDKIFFTGSVPVGKIVYQAAAKHLTPVTLELGGKSPAIISACADLKIAAKRLVWAKFLNAGQTCIAPDYLLVEQAVITEFLAYLKHEITESHFSFDNGNYVQIINEKNVNRLIAFIEPEKVVHGGSYRIEERYIEPTILYPVSPDDKVMQEEIFGPILPVMTYTNLDEVIAYIKDKPKPLSCYVFASKKAVSEKVLKEVSFGGGGVNEAVMHITNSNMPFGGVGDSGIGAYHGIYGFQTFSHYKSVIKKSTLFELNLKYFPRTALKWKIIKWMLKLG